MPYVLEEALKRPSKYIGMIGSKRKIKMVYDYLKDKGVAEISPGGGACADRNQDKFRDASGDCNEHCGASL